MLKISIKKKKSLILTIFLVLLIFSFWFKDSQLKIESFLGVFNKNFFQTLKKEFLVFAQANEISLPLITHYPTRLIELVSAINLASEELVNFNKALEEKLSESNCKYLLSQCQPKLLFGAGSECTAYGVFGTPHKNIKEIEEKKEQIADRIDNLSLLTDLLEKEMSGAVLRELTTLRREVADDLKNNLEEILKKSKNVVKFAKENQDLYNKDYTKNCVAQCHAGPVCGIKACAMVGSGVQRKVKFGVNVEFGIDNIELGEMGLDRIRFALPDKIKLSSVLPDILIKFPAQVVQVCVPSRPITLEIKPPYFTTLPFLNFDCSEISFFRELQELRKNVPRSVDFPFPFPIHKIPPKIGPIPFLKSYAAGKWCVGRDELLKEWKKIVDFFTSSIWNFQQIFYSWLRVVENAFNQAMNAVNEVLEKIVSLVSEEARKYLKWKRKLEEDYNKARNYLEGKEVKTEPKYFATPPISGEYQYRWPESRGLPNQISLFYNCEQTSGDTQIEPKGGINSYFGTLSWLMEKCASLPSMNIEGMPSGKVADCYNPDRIVDVIIQECNTLWDKYCTPEVIGGALVRGEEPPEFCKKIRKDCDQDNQVISAADECQALFRSQGMAIPSSCNYISAEHYGNDYYCSDPNYPTLIDNICVSKNFNPVSILQSRCEQLKDVEGFPEFCKSLPLFTGSIPNFGSQTYSGRDTFCPSQSILNLPFGFGGGIGLNCNLGLPNPPVIVLPDIVVPDIVLGRFNIEPFFELKLPSFLFEDIITPNVQLCDLSNCSDLFPYLSFKAATLKLPSLDISKKLFEGVELRTRGTLPNIVFSLPPISLFRFSMPEWRLPEISIPSPRLSFKFVYSDFGAIFDLLVTSVLNALSVPDFSGCLKFGIGLQKLSIILEDKYFSFGKFPEIPQIPFCQDVNEFCQNVKSFIEKYASGFIKKLEEKANELISESIQKNLDKAAQAIEEKVQWSIDKVFEVVYGRIIKKTILEELARRGLSFEDFINPQTKEIDLNKLPFPGVFPVKIEEGECLPISLPEVNIVIKFGDYHQARVVEKFSPQPIQYTIYLPSPIPPTIPIRWPEELKKIDFECGKQLCDQCMERHKDSCRKKCQQRFGDCSIKTAACEAKCYFEARKKTCQRECWGCLIYDLPTIPLCELNFKKEFPILGVGFQSRTASLDVSEMNQGDCLSKEPTGGNPFPMPEIKNKVEAMKNVWKELDRSSQKVIEILE